MKRTSVKVLISASIILSMIPFSLNEVAAEYPSQQVPKLMPIYSFEQVGDGYYFVADYFFISNVPISNTATHFDPNNLYIQANQYFTVPTNTWQGVLIEGDGVTFIDYEDRTSGSNSHSPKWVFGLDNCTYFHFQVKNLNASYWTGDKLTGPGQYARMAYNIGAYAKGVESLETSSIAANVMKILRAIENLEIGDITLDLTSTNALLQELIDLQTTNQSEIVELLNQLLQTQQNTPAQDSVDDNTQANDDLQTEQTTYENLEQQFNSDFTDNLNDINVTDWQTRLNNWSTGVNWLKTQMNTMFNAMGDYKYMLEIGMILAIALIFIGR